MENPDSCSPLLVPAINEKFFKPEQLTKANLEEWSERLMAWNLEFSKNLILSQNQYLNHEISLGKIGLCTAIFDRKSGKIEFSPLHISEKVTNNNP